ncbi:uncharacterized protein CELE_T19B10.12 [Caenorhabditis elegans]|uniref:Uncharacterized protein n=1 Tax=Caenorhabditis elegans TaxID=6239 RepID=A8DZ42_CAEEL|nr:Uncharacterized protein CELE_T19B10.12 [Caenorhabditis elegans]CAP09185.1 Uncharacterized protein CELE_T19B10.12 [Caenorhabditis elegans]|eukprot:NP_001123015.1 Uncharacterized protein CELE_T19B10.12 [Caenorhabditis elegans]
MNFYSIFLLILLSLFSIQVTAEPPRCQSENQCKTDSVCDDGHCLTVDEMFEKYGKGKI